MTQHTDIITMIRSAWADAIPPLAGNISGPTDDDEGVADYFNDKPWQGHNATTLRRLGFALTVFTDEAFAYYLPAYLIADIEEPEVSDTNAAGILSRLSSFQGPAVVARMNASQRSALRAYIAFFQERDFGPYDDKCARILVFLDNADAHV